MYDEYHVLKFLEKVNESLSMEEFEARMDMLSPESYKYLCTRWGLKKETTPAGPVTMNYLFEIDNSEDIVKACMAEFTYMKYVSYVVDRDELGPTLSHNLGYMLERANHYLPELFENLGPDTICGAALLEQIDTLREKHARILKATFGLEEGSPEIYTQVELGKIIHLSATRVGYYNLASYRMLAHSKRKKQFYLGKAAENEAENTAEIVTENTPEKEPQKEAETFVKVPLNLSALINDDLFVRQLEDIKKGAAIDNIIQLKDMRAVDLAELTGLAEEVCGFWIYMAKNIETEKLFEHLQKSIDTLYFLKKRTKQVLKRNGVNTIQDFIEISLLQVQSIPNVGEKTTEEIINARKTIGYPIK